MRGPKPPTIVLTDASAPRWTSSCGAIRRPNNWPCAPASCWPRPPAPTMPRLRATWHQPRYGPPLARRAGSPSRPSRCAICRVVERLSDAPRSGKPVRITDEQVCQIVELACEAPARSGRPISQWSAREIADEVRAPRHRRPRSRTATRRGCSKGGAPAAPLALLVDAVGRCRLRRQSAGHLHDLSHRAHARRSRENGR